MKNFVVFDIETGIGVFFSQKRPLFSEFLLIFFFYTIFSHAQNETFDRNFYKLPKPERHQFDFSFDAQHSRIYEMIAGILYLKKMIVPVSKISDIFMDVVFINGEGGVIKF